MGFAINNYKDELTKLFNTSVNVLSVSRSLKNISLELKLLAINGITQAARLGNKQGQSLITLSGFLSELPSQIEPELIELERLAGLLAYQITICSITLKKIIFYTKSLSIVYNNILSDAENKNEKVIDFFNTKDLQSVLINPTFVNDKLYQNYNLIYIIKQSIDLIEKLETILSTSRTIVYSINTKIERVSKKGTIANYMGSNISIEAAYLPTNHHEFKDLVINIYEIINILNDKLNVIRETILNADLLINNLLKNGFGK